MNILLLILIYILGYILAYFITYLIYRLIFFKVLPIPKTIKKLRWNYFILSFLSFIIFCLINEYIFDTTKNLFLQTGLCFILIHPLIDLYKEKKLKICEG